MRPEILFPLFASVDTLPGIGRKTVAHLEKLKITRVIDLLFHLPAVVIERRRVESVQGALPGDFVTLEVEVTAHRRPPRPTIPYKIVVEDARTAFHLVFFRMSVDYLQRTLPVGGRRVISGKLDQYDGHYQIAHPDYILPVSEIETIPRFDPVYRLTEGLTQRQIAQAIRAALERVPALPEWLPEALLAHDNRSFSAALEAAHAPQSADPEPPKRLVFDELFAHQLALQQTRARMRRDSGQANAGTGALLEALRALLPFSLTAGQEAAFADIAADMAAPERMLRLLQGDVGSGKTIVALMAMLTALEAGGQAALMAPTSLLAEQHYASLSAYALALGVRLTLLTSGLSDSESVERRALLKSGDAQIAIGTHALIGEGVEFADLRLIVIDEQHRFGVEQRLALTEKGQNAEKGGADILVMTATPIPRSLALAYMGDMDMSVIAEKPAGRQPIDTRLISMERYNEVVAGLRRAFKEGRRAYWVCSVVRESEAHDWAAVEDRFNALRGVFGEAAVMAHGQMPSAERKAAMRAFSAGEAQLLIATTIVEVGVDVPEASIMIIENAERFGLAQLHQLRGRVGRGADASSCLLLYQPPLGETALARLGVLRETDDGFRIAEEDLRLRGAGDLVGIRQAGIPDFRFVRLEVHAELLPQVRQAAGETGKNAALVLEIFERAQFDHLLSAG